MTEDAATASTWIAVACSGVGVAGAAITALFAFLNNKEKLKYETSKLEIESRMEELKDDHNKCVEHHEECRRELASIRTDLMGTRDRLDRAEQDRIKLWEELKAHVMLGKNKDDESKK